MSEKYPRRMERLLRANSKELKVVDAASPLGLLRKFPMNGTIVNWKSGESHMTIRRHNLKIAGRYLKPTPNLFLI